MNKLIKFTLLAVFLFACSGLPPFLQPTPESVTCTQLEITQEDVDDVLNYGEQVFKTSAWVRTTYTAEQQQVYVIYSHNTLYGLGFVSNIILCNPTVEVKNYANDENIAIILSNYDSYEVVDSCEQDGVLLFELSATADSREYNANLWFTPSEKPDRAVEVMVVIPKENPETLQEYSKKLFPQLPACK